MYVYVYIYMNIRIYRVCEREIKGCVGASFEGIR